MPSVLKRIDDYLGPWSDTRYLTMFAAIGVIIFGVVAVTLAQVLKWWEAAAIGGTIIVLLGALVWSCIEMSHLEKQSDK